MAARKKKTAASTARGEKPRASSKARGANAARALEVAQARSAAARRGWETRRAAALEAERRRLEALEKRRARDRERREAAREVERKRLAALEKRRTRERERREAAREAARQAEARETERKRLAALEKRRARDRERREAAKEVERKRLEAEQKKLQAAEKRKAAAKLGAQRRSEKARVCNDLLRDPPSDPEFAFNTTCFDASSYYRFKDGTWEGELVEIGRKNWRKAWDKIERYLKPVLANATGWWMRVGVFGFEPSNLGKGESDFDRDRYQKSRESWGKAFNPGSIGRYSAWRRIKPSAGRRTKFTTPATILLTGREMTKNFEEKGFKSLVISVRVYTGQLRPSGD